MSTTAAILDSPQSAHDTTEPPARSPHVAHTKPTGITEKTWHSLSHKGKIFVSVYVNGESALTAYEAAGYAADGDGSNGDHRQRNAYNVTRGKRVQRALAEFDLQTEDKEKFNQRWDLDEIVKEHERLLKVAETAGNLAVATRNLELIGRTRGVYADTVQVDVVARREYTEAEQIEMMRLSRYLLEEDAAAEADEQPAEDQAPDRQRETNGRFTAEEPEAVEGEDASGHRPDGNDDEGASQEKSEEE